MKSKKIYDYLFDYYETMIDSVNILLKQKHTLLENHNKQISKSKRGQEVKKYIIRK
jgi:hypothetical protein